MADLLRPPPPRSWRERLAARWAAITPMRLATGAGVVLLVAVTVWWLLRPGRLPVEASLPWATTASRTSAPRGGTAPGSAGTASPAATPTGGDAAGPPSTAAPELVVQAAGAVVRPGVYRLPAGSWVADLVAAAGGPAPDADLDRALLAAKLADGQRVAVPRAGQAAEPVVDPGPAGGGGGTTGSAGAGGAGPTTPLDLNAATVAELDTLPGVGPTTAAAIVAYRDRHGRFRSVDELTEVPGIGPAKLAALRDLVHA